MKKEIFNVMSKIMTIIQVLIIVVIPIGSLVMATFDMFDSNDNNLNETIITSQESQSTLIDAKVDKLEMISLIFNMIFIIVLSQYLKKLFKEIYENETPYTKNNLKYIKDINILVIILSICNILTGGGIIYNLILVFIIFALSYIFKYGYSLQQEVNEIV